MALDDAPGSWQVPTSVEHCCIYRVPNHLHGRNPEAYTPQFVLIGPLNHKLKTPEVHGDPTRAKSMNYLNIERHKEIYQGAFRQRFGQGVDKIEEFKTIITDNEARIRESYSESTAWINDDDFKGMILKDSVFIIEFLLKERQLRDDEREEEADKRQARADRILAEADERQQSADDRQGRATRRQMRENDRNRRAIERQVSGYPFFSGPCLENKIKRDLILLENQLPYFILEILFDSIRDNIYPGHENFRVFINNYFQLGQPQLQETIKHFTDLLRRAHVDTLDRQLHFEGDHEVLQHMHNAEKLDSAGVKLVARGTARSLVVSFDEEDGLSIPPFIVDGTTEVKLLNIMALEQCHYQRKAYVCNHIIFLDYLIDNEKDVEVLVKKGILMRGGDNALVAQIVNKLCGGLRQFGSYYSDIATHVNNFYDRQLTEYNKSFPKLKRTYFPDLWGGTATLAAITLLLLAGLQLLFAILEYKKKK